MASIKYPNKFDEQVKLFKLIYERHMADGDKSPLHDFKMQNLDEKANVAATSDKKSKEYIRLSEEQTQQRNLSFDQVMEEMRAIGAPLLKY